MPVYVEKKQSKKIPINRYSLYVYTPNYDPIFTERIKLFPVRYYHGDTKKWELPMSSLSLIFKNFRGVVVKGDLEEAQKKRFETIEQYKNYLETLKPEAEFTFKTKPDPHQVEWFNEMIERDRVILGDPPGLGKTKEYLDVAEFRKQDRKYQKILFICKSKHKYNMAKEIKTHTDSRLLIVEDSYDDRLDTLREFYSDDGIYYLIIGYEMATKHIKELKILAREMGFDGIIMDEFTKIKNWGGARKRKDDQPHLTIQITNLVEYINPELLILGSGTPLTKDPTDLYAPLRLVGIEKMEADQYKRRYCKLDTFGRIYGSQNEQELSEKLWSVMIRRPKELLGLPEPRITYLPLRMTADQQKLYTACKLQIKQELKGTKAFGSCPLSIFTRLRQITTDPKLVGANIEGIKEMILKEYIDQATANDEKVVVFSVYAEETRYLRKELEEYHPAYIDGTMNAREAQAEADKLQDDERSKILIGSLLATMESYTLTRANHAFFLDESWTVTDNEQAWQRVHRRGQIKTSNVIIPYCEGTIDERVLEIHAEDSALINEVVNGGECVITHMTAERLLE
jgi:SNF2 family DNA or RNA helicase